MFLSNTSIKRPIMMTMILLVFLLFGTLAYFGLNLELTPDIALPAITIQTVYAGAGPKEIETQITKPIEDAVSSVSNIDYMRSFSMEGVSFVLIMFHLNKDEDIASQEVKDKIDGILNDLPDDADRPIVQKWDPTREAVLELVLSGDIPPTELYDIADKTLKNQLSQIDGVANIEISGGAEREIKIELLKQVAYQNDISLNQLAQWLQAQNLDMPAGSFKRGTQDISVRMKGEFTDLQTIENLEYPTAAGPKRISDIGVVRDTGADVTERTAFYDNVTGTGNDNVVVLGILKSDDGNTVEIAHQLKDRLPELRKLVPEGLSLNLATDNSTFAEDTVEDTLSTIILGVILTAIILLLFLHDLRSTIIVALSMPMSILSTFMLLQMSGFTLNIMSLMGLSTSVGILVSNSVVVIENIFRYKNLGKNKVEAASRGTAEVVAAVMAATLTNLVVFLPIANMTSIVGTFFRQFGLTVVYATVFSLLMSFTLVPMMASKILPEKLGTGGAMGKMSESFVAWIERKYKSTLEYFLRNKKRGLGFIGFSLVLLIIGFGLGGQVGFDFMPRMDEGDMNIEIEMPLGYRLDQTADLVRIIEDKLHEYKQVKYTLTTIGGINTTNTGTNMAKVKVKLVNATQRKETTDEMAAKFTEDFSQLPNAMIRVLPVSSVGTGESPIQLVVTGLDMDTLEVYANRTMAAVEDIPGIVGLNSSSRPGKPEITLHPDRKKLSDAGLTVYDLAITLRSAIEGVVTTRYRDLGEEYDIRLSMVDEAVDTPEEIANLTVVAPTGTYRMEQLTDLSFAGGYSKIEHYNRQKSILITANVAPGFVLGNITNEMDLRLADFELPAGYHYVWQGNVKLMNETLADMMRTFLIALILTYMLLAAILESLTQPLIILGTVPLAFIGVFSALVISGVSMNSISMMAIVMLLGIVVNNAILQLDFANQLIRDQKKSMTEALLEACPAKMRPIIMSTLAIILGMLPMALGLGASGKEIRQSMGVVSIGGLIASTLLALVVIPVLANLFAKKQKTEVGQI
ncbi:MAG: efflux RND transporter permease subunit [Candidatus Zixiibacteriota bacterium]